MNPKTQRTILKQSRIFGYSGAVLSIPFGFLGGLIASCCPLGVLVGAIPLLITSGLGAQLAAIFLDYSVVSRRNSTGAGLRVGVRSATISALAGGIIIVLTASQSLSAMTAAAGNGDPEGGGVAAAIVLGLINLLFLLVLVGCCALLAIVPGVIGAAIRGSAALDAEPEPEPGWDAELKALKKSSLIEWAVLLCLLAACAIIIPTIQQYSMGKSHPRQQEMAGSGQADYVSPGLFPGVPPVTQTPDQAFFRISQDGTTFLAGLEGTIEMNPSKPLSLKGNPRVTSTTQKWTLTYGNIPPAYPFTIEMVFGSTRTYPPLDRVFSERFEEWRTPQKVDWESYIDWQQMEPLKNGSELVCSAGFHDFNGDDYPEVVVAMGYADSSWVFDFSSLQVWSFHPPEEVLKTGRKENWELLLQTDFQRGVLIEGRQIILPVGSREGWRYTLVDGQFVKTGLWLDQNGIYQPNPD